MAEQLSLFKPAQTRASLANGIWRACDILRRDNNCGGVMEYVEHLAWLLFLRFLDAQEEVWETEAALEGRPYQCRKGKDKIDDDLMWVGPVTQFALFLSTRRARGK